MGERKRENREKRNKHSHNGAQHKHNRKSHSCSNEPHTHRRTQQTINTATESEKVSVATLQAAHFSWKPNRSVETRHKKTLTDKKMHRLGSFAVSLCWKRENSAERNRIHVNDLARLWSNLLFNIKLWHFFGCKKSTWKIINFIEVRFFFCILSSFCSYNIYQLDNFNVKISDFAWNFLCDSKENHFSQNRFCEWCKKNIHFNFSVFYLLKIHFWLCKWEISLHSTFSMGTIELCASLFLPSTWFRYQLGWSIDLYWLYNLENVFFLQVCLWPTVIDFFLPQFVISKHHQIYFRLSKWYYHVLAKIKFHTIHPQIIPASRFEEIHALNVHCYLLFGIGEPILNAASYPIVEI